MVVAKKIKEVPYTTWFNVPHMLMTVSWFCMFEHAYLCFHEYPCCLCACDFTICEMEPFYCSSPTILRETCLIKMRETPCVSKICLVCCRNQRHSWPLRISTCGLAELQLWTQTPPYEFGVTWKSFILLPASWRQRWSGCYFPVYKSEDWDSEMFMLLPEVTQLKSGQTRLRDFHL